MRDLMAILSYFVLAAFQIGWHWLVLQPSAKPLLNVYLYRDPVSLKGNPGYFDIVLPSFLLGLAIGGLGWKWSPMKIGVYVIIGGIVIAILEPTYSLVLGRSLMWWLPASDVALIGQTIVQAFKATVTTGAFVYAMHLSCKQKYGNSGNNLELNSKSRR